MLTAFLRTRRVYDFSIVDEIYLTFRPEKYLHDSYSIHGISLDESNEFDDKWDSFRYLLKYMLKYRDSLFCCHANHLVFGAYGYFDEQVIRSTCLYQSPKTYYWYQQKDFKWISTHTISKRLLNLENYKLNTVANYYGFLFDHHNCKDDVAATETIFREMINADITKDELFNIGNYNGDYRRFSERSESILTL